MTELQYKNDDIGRLKREIESLKRTVAEQAEMIKTLQDQLNQQSKEAKLTELLVSLTYHQFQNYITRFSNHYAFQDVAKQVIDRYQKGKFSDSTMYPTEGVILKTVMGFYAVSNNGQHKMLSLLNADRMELGFHLRERRNRISPKIRKCFTIFNDNVNNMELKLRKIGTVASDCRHF